MAATAFSWCQARPPAASCRWKNACNIWSKASRCRSLRFLAAGRLIGANEVARPLLGFQNLVDAGLDDARHEALKVGAVVTAIDIGRMVLQRVGSGADIGLVALLVPDVAPVAEPEPVAAELPEEKLPDVEPPVSAITAHAVPEHEPPAPKSEVPTPLELFDAFAEPPAADEPVAAQPSASEPHVAPPDPAPHFDAIADEPPAPLIETPAPPIAAHEEVPALLDASSPAARRLPLRFMWQMDRDGRFSLGADEFTRLIGPRTVAGFGRLWREISEAYGLDPRRPRDAGVRHAPDLERHHAELARRWRQRLAGRIVGPADLRSRAEFCRLSGFWRLPRSRRPGAAGRVAPLRILRWSARGDGAGTAGG